MRKRPSLSQGGGRSVSGRSRKHIESATRANEPSETKHEGLSATIARLLALASFSGVVLTLLGYGAALAAEARFGMPRAQFIDSTLDMLDLSAWVILRIVSKGFEAFGDLNFYKKALWELRYVVLILLVVWVLSLTAIYCFDPRAKKYRRAKVAKRSERGQNEAGFKYAFRRTWWMPVSIALAPLGMLLGIVAIIFAATVLAIVPIVGMNAGKAHIDEFVIKPERCASVINRVRRIELLATADSARNETGAQCASVTFIEGGRQVKGRVVFALSKALILYDPETGLVIRAPTGNAIVEVIPNL